MIASKLSEEFYNVLADLRRWEETGVWSRYAHRDSASVANSLVGAAG
jgi:hypothetical protein